MSDGKFNRRVDEAADRIRRWVLSRQASPARWPVGHPSNERYWVPSNGSFEMVAEMTREYGLDHLQEAAWALQGLRPEVRNTYQQFTKLGVGLNAGGGLVELLFRLTGVGGEKTILIDYCDACGEYASEIFSAFGQDRVEFVNSSKHMKRIQQIEPHAMLSASHALNVQNRDPVAQQQLIDVNAVILDRLAFGTVEPTYFFSLEPSQGRYQIDFLMEKFQEAGHAVQPIVPQSVLNQTGNRKGRPQGRKTAVWGVAGKIKGRRPITGA